MKEHSSLYLEWSKFSSPRLPIGWRYTCIFPVCQRIYNYRCRWKRLYRLHWFLGANDHGHCHPPVIEALKSATDNTTSFGAPTAIETEIAELICDMVHGRKSTHGELWNGSLHVGHPCSKRIYGQREIYQIRRLLSWSCRCFLNQSWKWRSNFRCS